MFVYLLTLAAATLMTTRQSVLAGANLAKRFVIWDAAVLSKHHREELRLFLSIILSLVDLGELSVLIHSSNLFLSFIILLDVFKRR